MKYYYSKYNTITTLTNFRNPRVIYTSSDTFEVITGVCRNYTFDNVNGFSAAGSIFAYTGSDARQGDIIYRVISQISMIEYKVIEPYVEPDTVKFYVYISEYGCDYDTIYSKGELIEEGIIAEDGTYPDNGRHTDGYWYVKGALVAPNIPVKVNSKWHNSESFVKVNGTWKQVTEAFVKIDGEWETIKN